MVATVYTPWLDDVAHRFTTALHPIEHPQSFVLVVFFCNVHIRLINISFVMTKANKGQLFLHAGIQIQ
jgi:hypothetical protein